MSNRDRVFTLLAEAKRIAGEYYSLTGKPLGVTGEASHSSVLIRGDAEAMAVFSRLTAAQRGKLLQRCR